MTLDWGTRRFQAPCCGKPWPELSLGMMSPSGENRGGTPTGERAPLSARRTRWCGSWSPRLSAFGFPFFFSQ